MAKPYQESAANLPDGMRIKSPTVDLADQRFGRLVAVKVVGKHTNNSLLWLCRCDCGNEVVRTSASLRKRKDAMSSCGCYLREISRERLASIEPWNKGTTYRNKPIEHEYATKGAWGDAVRREKGDACERCGWDEAVCDVHHIIPRSEGGKNTIDNGRVLCPNCHRVEHTFKQMMLKAANDNSHQEEQIRCAS